MINPARSFLPKFLQGGAIQEIFERGLGLLSIQSKDNNAKSEGDYSIAIGRNCSALEEKSISIGEGNTVSSTLGIAIGEGINVTGYSAIALGNQTRANGDFSFAVSRMSTTAGNYSATIGGYGHNVSGENSAIIGGHDLNLSDDNAVLVPRLKTIEGVYSEDELILKSINKEINLDSNLILNADYIQIRDDYGDLAGIRKGAGYNEIEIYADAGNVSITADAGLLVDNIIETNNVIRINKPSSPMTASVKMRTPDGTKEFAITIDNNGNLITTQV